MKRVAAAVFVFVAVGCSSSKRIATISVDPRSRVLVELKVTDYAGKKILDESPVGYPSEKIPNGEASYELPAEGKACITGIAFPEDDQRLVFCFRSHVNDLGGEPCG